MHYLRNVLRLREGRTCGRSTPTDGEWLARIVASGRHRLDLLVEQRLRAPAPEPGPTLVFAPIRRNRLEWLVEKAVELGAAGLVPVLTRRTVVRPEKAGSAGGHRHRGGRAMRAPDRASDRSAGGTCNNG